MKIAGNFTVADWNAMKAVLKSDQNSAEIWKLTFETFFRTRIETRYFVPIRLLQQHLENQGEGFSIVALQCSLIEFLASISDTTNCRCDPPEPSKTKCECGKIETVEKKCNRCNSNIISNSKRFTDFLRNKKPFKNEIESSDIANSFYADVRCALLHDAHTKGKWKICAKSNDGKTIKWTGKSSEKFLYRNNLQNAFEEYIDKYGKELTTCKDLQEAFIRKFDSLNEE